MYQLIEDLFYLKPTRKQRNANWFLSAGNHQATITSLRFGLPIILSMTRNILQELELAQEQVAAISLECEQTKKSCQVQILESIKDLEDRLAILQEKIYDQNRNSELSLLKSRATRTQALELQSFLKSAASFLPPELAPQCEYLSTRQIPSFNETVQWSISTIPNFPKIPLTKYTLYEPGENLQRWEDFTETKLTAQDLELPQSHEFTPREKSIVSFYENQIKEMQSFGIINSSHSNRSDIPPDIRDNSIQFTALRDPSQNDQPTTNQVFIMQSDLNGSFALVTLNDNPRGPPSPTTHSNNSHCRPSDQSLLPPFPETLFPLMTNQQSISPISQASSLFSSHITASNETSTPQNDSSEPNSNTSSRPVTNTDSPGTSSSPQTSRCSATNQETPSNDQENTPHTSNSPVQPLYSTEQEIGIESRGATSLPLYAHLSLNHQRQLAFRSSQFYKTHRHPNGDNFQIAELSEVYHVDQPETPNQTSLHSPTIYDSSLSLSSNCESVPPTEHPPLTNDSTQQTINSQMQTTQFFPLSEINHHIKQIQLCPFVSTHSPPFTCVQYIGILHHKIGASESFGDKIRNKNWDLIKVLRVRNHLIKQLFLRTAFLKFIQIGKDQLLSHALENENFLNSKIQKQKALIAKAIEDKERAIHDITVRVVNIHQENQKLKLMVPTQPFFHWIAKQEELLKWHTEHFEIKGLSCSPTPPFLQWINKHDSLQKWHSQNFINKDLFTRFQPFLTTLECTFPSSQRHLFTKWKSLSRQSINLKLSATKFCLLKSTIKATLTNTFTTWKFKHLNHKNSVLTTVSNCYLESLNTLRHENNATNSQYFQFRNLLATSQLKVAQLNQEITILKHKNLELQQQNSFLLNQLDQMNKNADIAHTMIASLSDQYHYLISNKPPSPQLANQLTQTSDECQPSTMDIAIHDQLVNDLRDEFNEEKAHILQEFESMKENLEIKSMEHELNLVQFQRLKEDFATLYNLIITFGNDPVTIPLKQNQIKPPSTASQQSSPPQSLPDTSSQATSLDPPPPSQEHTTEPPVYTERIQTRFSLASTPITPATYKQKLSKVPSNSFLNLGEPYTAQPMTPIPHRKTVQTPKSQKSEHAPPPTLSSPHYTTSHTMQEELPFLSQSSLTIGTRKQVLAIQSIQPIIPVQHPTIFQTPRISANMPQLSGNSVPASKEIAEEYGIDLIDVLQNIKKRRKQS